MVFGLNRETVLKMCRFSLPQGYTHIKPVTKPRLGPLLPVIDGILEADRTGPVKQRHTAKPIYERLRDEDGFGGGYVANFAILATLPQKGDLVVLDELIHASAHEGARAGWAAVVEAPHNDVGGY